MTKRMLIDATHAEETRVVVLDGNRLEDFDVETSTKRQLKGNIYLAKVVRVEPSLQACFVEYGGNRHGFLAFSEIHPDYYQIPVADRQRLIEMEAEEARREEEEADREMEGSVEPWSPPAARSAEEASEETGDETRAAAGMLRDAGPEPPPPWEAPSPGAAPEETGEESSATAGMLRDAEPEPPPPWESAAPSPAATPVETGDESGATATLPNDRGAEPAPRAAAGDWMPEDAAPSEAAAASPEPAEGVTGALGKMPVAPVPAQPTPAQAAPAQAAPEQVQPGADHAPTGRKGVHGGADGCRAVRRFRAG